MTTTIAKKQNGTPSVAFGNVVDNFFQNSLRRFFDNNFWETERLPASGSVPVNVRETENQYELDVIAPGCKKDDFDIRLDKNLLTISFNRKNQQENQHTGWVRNEFEMQSFTRSFTLDDTVDTDHISANYTDGILQLALPKNEKARQVSRSIRVQ